MSITGTPRSRGSTWLHRRGTCRSSKHYSLLVPIRRFATANTMATPPVGPSTADIATSLDCSCLPKRDRELPLYVDRGVVQGLIQSELSAARKPDGRLVSPSLLSHFREV